MTTEREMLEYSAKACGIEAFWEREQGVVQERYLFVIPYINQGLLSGTVWNPITSSADCAAMCAKLLINTLHGPNTVQCFVDDGVIQFGYLDEHNNDREATWRFAACKVAEAIGRGMK